MQGINTQWYGLMVCRTQFNAKTVFIYASIVCLKTTLYCVEHELHELLQLAFRLGRLPSRVTQVCIYSLIKRLYSVLCIYSAVQISAQKEGRIFLQ